ncbi:hypothetical protein G166_gp76 [Clostridium phage phi8074-B1]|uniref:hypothetical protein n=1 Tax=Clostridium phage phi8074-B1 TaxID=1147137 RepID=UPI00025C0C7F|nr:hypothetical protein G166_gp76 [Clostridium phage phi8074-B1]AFC62008.1 hypothetical protein phi8074-B1_00076 [Clostridium phage phi8074-B1]
MVNYGLKIGGLTYDLQLLDSPPKLNGNAVLGMINYDRQEIYISNEQHIETKLVTILHEILHGIVHDRNLPVGGNEENIVDGLSRGIYQILVDNPRLMNMLVYKLHEMYKEED